MEEDGYHLKVFCNSLRDYCTIKLHDSCLPDSLRKHNVKKEKGLEFTLNFKHSNSLQAKLDEEDILGWIKASESWSLRLASISTTTTRLELKLNRLHTFNIIIPLIEEKQSEFGRNSTISQSIAVCCDAPRCPTDLREYRTRLLTDVISNLLRGAGFTIGDEQQGTEAVIVFCREGAGRSGLLVGPVVDTETRCKVNMTVAQYHEVRTRDMLIMTEHRDRLDGDSEGLAAQLAQACVTMDLIRTCPRQAVKLMLQPEATTAREPSHKGAAFILYNRTRLASLQEQFKQRQYEGVEVRNANLSLLREPEEWGLIFNFLLEYPSVLEKAAQISSPGPHLLCNFLLGLASLISVYYRRVKVLQEPKPHLMPVMAARLRLLAAVLQVYDNILTILGISKLSAM